MGEDLFHYVMFCYKENRDLSSKIQRVYFGGISQDLQDCQAYLCPS